MATKPANWSYRQSPNPLSQFIAESQFWPTK